MNHPRPMKKEIGKFEIEEAVAGIKKLSSALEIGLNEVCEGDAGLILTDEYIGVNIGDGMIRLEWDEFESALSLPDTVEESERVIKRINNAIDRYRAK